MKRLILLLLLPALLLLGGCMPYVRQTPEEETTLITVGFSQVGAESDWRVANTESMRESLSEENGFELLFDNARQKQENQFKAIRTFIQQDVDYIVLAPVTETGWESVLEEARAAAIPVIIVDRQVELSDVSLYTSWVGSDFRKTADERSRGWQRRWRRAKMQTRRCRSCICRERPAPRRSFSALPRWKRAQPRTRAGRLLSI